MSSAQPAAQAQDFLLAAAERADAALARLLPSAEIAPVRLHTAMRYSVFAGGKRLRPALVLAAAGLAAPAETLAQAPIALRCDAAMAAVELLHTYTLIHDDLPAMDDDDLRRGLPTCHKAFDEATAILAGDALQALAFQAVAAIDAEAVMILARAAGSLGVVGGQQDDMDWKEPGKSLPGTVAATRPGKPAAGLCERLETIHLRKTAALISASCELGACAVGASEPCRRALAAFGTSIGLAFQIADDILDATASTATLGKTAGKDQEQGKLTYVAVHGLEAARREAERLLDQALGLLSSYPRSDSLIALARFIVQRDR